MRRILLLLVGVLLAVVPAQAQTVEVAGSTLAIGTSPTSPSGTSVRLDNLGTSGGTLVLLTDTDGDVFERVLAKSDLPATVGYTDEAETWSLLQTFTSGLTSNGLVTIGGANDLLLGTGGMRVASGSILLRNIADSATIASFGDSAIALNQPTTITGNSSVTGTWGVSGLSTLTGGFTAGASSSVTGTLTATTLAATGAATVGTTLGVTGLSTLTGGFSAGANSSVTGNLTLSGDLAVNGGDITSTAGLTLTPTTNLTLSPAGDVYLSPTGNDILPGTPYEKNIGALTNKYLTLHAAELWVETLVAQETIATIGGRILVGPTTQLTSDLADTDTEIVVKHNQMASGDRVYMEANGQVEFMSIDSGPTGTGGGDLSITRTGAGSAGATTITLPTHASGDYIVIFAYRASSTAGITLPGGWTSICDGGADNNSYRIGYKVAASASETSGTWTSATHLHALVYEGVTGFGDCQTLSGTGTTTLSYPALTLTDSDGSSKVARFGMAGAGTNVEAQTPAGGYGLVTDFDATQDSAVFESSAGVTSVTQSNVTLDNSGNVRGVSLEILGTTTPTTGPYSYDVTRNLDGSGANDWSAGDAVFNTGASGDGFIDLYSVRGVKSGSEYGPTIVGNVRTSSTYNAWSPRWAVGNLNGLYGYATDIYGLAAGDASDVWIGVDATNGIRMMEAGTTQRAQFALDGSITLGNASSTNANTYITAASVALRRGTTSYATLSSSGLTLTDGTNTRVQLDATDGLVLGRTASGNGNVWADTSGNIHLRSGTTQRISLAAANGSISVKDAAGDARVLIDSNGLTLGLTATGNGNIHMDTSGNMAFRVGSTNKITMAASTGDLSLVGALTIGTSGSLSSGATAYATGTGYWLDYNAGTPRFYIGNGSSSTSEYLTWNGTALSVSGSLRALSDLVLGGSANITKGSGALTISNTSTGQNMTLAAGGGAGTLIVTAGGFQIGGGTGVSATKTVRDSAGTGTCTLIFTYGVLTGGSC